MMDVDPDNEATYRIAVVPSDPKQISKPKHAILKELEGCGFCGDAVFAIKLALEEALINALKHGNRGDPSKSITIRYAVTPAKVVVIVRDEGEGFDEGSVPDPTQPHRLPVPNGRGIMLMRSYMDEVEYRDGGREVRFVKHRE
jgi:serine/threonine-protein kinase RsbW